MMKNFKHFFSVYNNPCEVANESVVYTDENLYERGSGLKDWGK